MAEHSNRVFGIPELLELTLSFTDPLVVLTSCREVCRSWRELIDTSPVLLYYTWQSNKRPGRIESGDADPTYLPENFRTNPMIGTILQSFWKEVNSDDSVWKLKGDVNTDNPFDPWEPPAGVARPRDTLASIRRWQSVCENLHTCSENDFVVLVHIRHIQAILQPMAPEDSDEVYPVEVIDGVRYSPTLVCRHSDREMAADSGGRAHLTPLLIDLMEEMFSTMLSHPYAVDGLTDGLDDRPVVKVEFCYYTQPMEGLADMIAELRKDHWAEYDSPPENQTYHDRHEALEQQYFSRAEQSFTFFGWKPYTMHTFQVYHSDLLTE